MSCIFAETRSRLKPELLFSRTLFYWANAVFSVIHFEAWAPKRFPGFYRESRTQHPRHWTTMPEFEEIGNAGGKIEILHDSQHSVSLRFSHSSAGPCSLFQLGVSLDGKVIRHIPLRGMDMRPPEPPPQLAPVMIVSDREGFFGRNCPECHSYFRTTRPAEVLACPYCSHRDRNERFTTENQLLFVTRVREAYRQAIESKQTVTIDLDKIARDLPSNRPAWAYSEESQQNRFTCPGPDCHTDYDILGEYAGCPTCSKRN